MLALSETPNRKNLTLLFIAAFIVRVAMFFFYVQHEERYHQADSNDYHIYALSTAVGKGMINLNTMQPTFWRTPGYTLFLSWFYGAIGIHSGKFSENAPAQKAALWVQIFLCSFIPIIIFYLALLLTSSLSIAWITAWISVFHLGLVLSSTFLLTEGLTLIFFYLFLIYFFKSFACIGETPLTDISWKKNLILAAFFLIIATWIRPMGEFVAIACSIMLLLFAQDGFGLKCKKIALFLFVFFLGLTPWYARNYQLTGKLFFCPMFGTYLNSFVAPKILRETTGLPLEKTWRYLQTVASQKAAQELPKVRAMGKSLVLEHMAGSIAWPIVMEHPFIAFKVWMPEVFKTTFDLYASQLVAFANNTFMWDPLEEFLPEKIALALYKQPMPLWMRLICWLEFLYALLLWLSLCAGVILFWIIPLYKRFAVPAHIKAMAGLWLKCAFLIGSICFMTGGFGYARLRLPVEPLMIVLALTVLYKRKG